MKIIGNATGGKLLIEATPDEVANIMGAFSAYQLKDIGLKSTDLKPGMEIKVSSAWSRLYWLSRKQDQFSELRKACEQALKHTAQLESVFSVIKGESQEDAA